LPTASTTTQPTPPPTPRPAARRRPRRRRRWWIALAVLILIAAAVAAGVLRPKPATKVQTALVERVEKLESIVSATGTVEAKESVDLQAEIAGVIIELPVREGDWLEEGQVLVRIDSFPTEAELEGAKAQLLATEADARAQAVQIALADANVARDIAFQKTAEAELVETRARLDLAEKQYQRTKDLFDRGVEPVDRLDEATATLEATRAQLEAIQARIVQYEAQVKATRLTRDQYEAAHEAALQRAEASRANMERAEDSLKKTTIYSPLKGLLTHLNVEKGERAVPGILSNPEATLMTIADMSVLEAHLLVDETDIVQVAVGHPVEVVVDALPDTPLQGTVTEIGNSPVSQGGLQSGSQEGKDFLVKVRLLEPPASLRPGMSCEGDITTAVKEDLLVIPIQALTRRDVRIDEEGNYVREDLETLAAKKEESAKHAADPVVREKEKKEELEGVFLKGPDLRARFQPVETGITGEMDIELVSGLSAGDEIIVGPFKALRALSEGDRIRVDNRGFEGFSRREKE